MATTVTKEYITVADGETEIFNTDDLLDNAEEILEAYIMWRGEGTTSEDIFYTSNIDSDSYALVSPGEKASTEATFRPTPANYNFLKHEAYNIYANNSSSEATIEYDWLSPISINTTENHQNTDGDKYIKIWESDQYHGNQNTFVNFEYLSGTAGASVSVQLRTYGTRTIHHHSENPQITINGQTTSYSGSLEDGDDTDLIPVSGLVLGENTIQHNVSDSEKVEYKLVITYKQINRNPTAPSNLSPSNGEPVDRNEAVRLSWTFSDPDDNDSQSKFDLRWRAKGASNWNETTQVTPNNFHDLTGLPYGEIEWQVRTYDQEEAASEYSSTAIFVAGNKPSKPTITNYDESIANPTINWSSSGQSSYIITVYQNNNQVYQSTGGTAKSHTITYDLLNNTQYVVEVRIINDIGLESSPDSIVMNMSYTPPEKATIQAINNKNSILLTINNPIPTESEPAAAYNNIYRSENGSEFIRIANNLPPNTNFIDYNVASGKEYTYYVRARGDNDTYSDSETTSNQTKFNGVWLHDVTDESTLHHFIGDGNGRTNNWQSESANLQFAGRKYPVTYFGEQVTNSVSATLEMPRRWKDHEALNRIVKAKNIVCYRDGVGRKIFGTITELPINDVNYGYETEITITETSYSEEV